MMYESRVLHNRACLNQLYLLPFSTHHTARSQMPPTLSECLPQIAHTHIMRWTRTGTHDKCVRCYRSLQRKNTMVQNSQETSVPNQATTMSSKHVIAEVSTALSRMSIRILKRVFRALRVLPQEPRYLGHPC